MIVTNDVSGLDFLSFRNFDILISQKIQVPTQSQKKCKNHPHHKSQPDSETINQNPYTSAKIMSTSFIFESELITQDPICVVARGRIRGKINYDYLLILIII